MKTLLKTFSVTILLLASTAFARDSSRYYYLAANTGIFQADFSNVYRDQTDVIAQNIAETAIQHGYTIGGAAGYRRFFSQNYFYGGEFSIHVEGHQASFKSGASTTAFSDNVQIQYHADFTFVPGIQLNETISSYLKLGISYASLQDTLNSPVGATAITTTYNTHKNALGFAAGLGVSTLISYTASIFAETDYHDYGTVDFQNINNFSAAYSHSSHVYSYDVVVGMSYRFLT